MGRKGWAAAGSGKSHAGDSLTKRVGCVAVDGVAAVAAGDVEEGAESAARTDSADGADAEAGGALVTAIGKAGTRHHRDTGETEYETAALASRAAKRVRAVEAEAAR